MSKKILLVDNRVNVNGKKPVLHLESFSKVYSKEGVDELMLTQTGPQGVQGVQGVTGAIGPAGLTWEGAWAVGTTYAVDDAVSSGGSSYFCITAVTGGNAPATNASWALLASQGAQGIQGVQGIQGLSGGSVSAINDLTDGYSLLNSIGLGGGSLGANTTGNYNVGTGNYALRRNTTGARNVGYGYGSGYTNTTGHRNTALGMQALYYNSVSDNTGVGESALGSTTTGASNTAIGMKAGFSNISGSNNIIIGSGVNAASTTADNQLNIGNWIHGSAGKIGIGTSAPTSKLQVVGLLEYANEAAAVSGGVLTTGAFYRTATGVLMVKL